MSLVVHSGMHFQIENKFLQGTSQSYKKMAALGASFFWPSMNQSVYFGANNGWFLINRDVFLGCTGRHAGLGGGGYKTAIKRINCGIFPLLSAIDFYVVTFITTFSGTIIEPAGFLCGRAGNEVGAD